MLNNPRHHFRSAVVYPLRAMLDLSTTCLSPETREWLDGLDWNKEGPSGGKGPYGWFLYAHDDNLCLPSAPHAPDGEFPSDLWACFCRARELGADYVQFDCDAVSDDPAVSDLAKWGEDDEDDDGSAEENVWPGDADHAKACGLPAVEGAR